MKAKSNKLKQREFKTRQKKLGLVQVTLWVPKAKKAFMKMIASTLLSNYKHTDINVIERERRK